MFIVFYVFNKAFSKIEYNFFSLKRIYGTPLYLDGSGQVGSLLAEVEEASNGYPIGQIVDE